MLLPLLLLLCCSSAESKAKVVVIGTGFAGYGAAKALCSQGCSVTLISDAADPLSKEVPYLTKSGKRFEAGFKGFWKDYPNIEQTVSEYLGLDKNDVWSTCTNSSFYSPFGLEATAPVFGDSGFGALPSPLGQVLASNTLFVRLPLADRATMVGLLVAMLDYNKDEKTFIKYDKMTAAELFVKFKLSKRLVDDFITPTLLVGLFKKPVDLSAAVVMELLYYYALAHTNSFDVKWMRKETIQEAILSPLAAKLCKDHQLAIVSRSRVSGLSLSSDGRRIVSVAVTASSGEKSRIDDFDACVLAVGAKGLRGILEGSPQLASISPQLRSASTLGSIDCISTRIWLDRKVATRTPANVFANFPQLNGAGGTFFMLDQLQGSGDLWRDHRPAAASSADVTDTTPKGSVLACDFYNSGGLMALPDDGLQRLLMDELLPAAVPEFRSARVLDFYAQRYPGAVSWFSPGSYPLRPTTRVDGVSNLAMAGDWVNMGDNEHGAKGLCQERAFVSGIVAANSLLARGLNGYAASRDLVKVLPIREDEAQVRFGRLVARGLGAFGFEL